MGCEDLTRKGSCWVVERGKKKEVEKKKKRKRKKSFVVVVPVGPFPTHSDPFSPFSAGVCARRHIVVALEM